MSKQISRPNHLTLEQVRELLSNCYRYEIRSKPATVGEFVEWENLFGYKVAKAWASASGQTATLLVWEPGSSEFSSLFEGPEILSVMDLGLEGDLSFEAAQLMLRGCTRSTCQDSAFGDAEVFWNSDGGELIATGYFGRTQEVTIWPEAYWRLVEFEGAEAQILRDCGAEGRTDENASSFRDDYDEEDEDDENVVDADE
jgi:hypothetical protein